MKDDREQNDRSQYTDTGFRDPDGREGFGDDAGTRVGRPDGAESARPAPRDAQLGDQVPGQAGTNTDPVSNGIEGSLTGATGDDSEGPQQSRVRAASGDVERPDGSARDGSADSRIDDL